MTHQPTDLRQEREARDKQAEQKRLKELERVTDLQWLMEHPEGRRFMWWLLERAGVYRTTFDANATVMAFREGHRNLGVMLEAECRTHVLERYIQMLKEQKRNAA